MHKYVLKRLLMLIPVIIGVTFVVFFILNLAPGDPAAGLLGQPHPRDRRRLPQHLRTPRRNHHRLPHHVRGADPAALHRGAGQNLTPGIRRSDGRRIAGSSVKKPRRKTRLTPQTTLQHSGCSVVSAVKTIWLPPPSRLPPAKPRTVSVPAVRLRLTRPRSMPLCIPFRSTLSLPASSCTSGPFPPAHLSAPSLCSFPQRAAQPAPPRSLPFRHSPGSAHRNYSSKKQKNAPFFLFFHFLAPYLSYK